LVRYYFRFILEHNSIDVTNIIEPNKPHDEDATPPKFIKQPAPQTVPEGQVAILEAKVESSPVCSFQWFHNNKPIQVNSFVLNCAQVNIILVYEQSCPEMRIAVEDNKSVLMISESYSEFAGLFTCRAENALGSITSTTTVAVVERVDTEELVAPMFVQPLASLRVMDGEEVHFMCEVLNI
jgi:titin